MDFLVIDHKKVPRAALIAGRSQNNPKNKLKLDIKVQENVNGKTDTISEPGAGCLEESHDLLQFREGVVYLIRYAPFMRSVGGRVRTYLECFGTTTIQGVKYELRRNSNVHVACQQRGKQRNGS